MSRRPFQLNPRHRYLVHASILAVLFTGLLWTLAWHGLRQEPDVALPWENRVMQAHLIAAFATVLAVGSCMPQHASKSWAARINRWAGSGLGLALGAAFLTAFFILAFSWEEDAHEILHYTHIAAGVSVPIALVVHIVIGRRKHRKGRRDEATGHSKVNR